MNGCAGSLGHLPQGRRPRARADSRSPRATKVGTRQAIASVRISVSPSSSARSIASVSIAQDLLAAASCRAPSRSGPAPWRARRGRPAAAPARPRSSRTIAAALALALEVERPGEPGEQADPQLAAPVPQRRQRLLQQLDRALARHPRAPAGFLVADRRPRQQLGAAQPAGDLRRRREGLQRIGRLAGAVAGRAELEQSVRALGARPRSRSRSPSAAAPRPRRRRAPRSAARAARQVVLDRPLGAAERRRCAEMVGEVRERRGRRPRRRCSSRASPTRRWSSARRSRESRS